MTYPKQKRYTLEEAAKYIEYETNVPCSSNSLLQVAKTGTGIGINFFINNTNLRFIRLDKKDDKWQSVPCEPLFGNGLERCVIPIDNSNQDSHSIHTINPQKETTFPILSDNPLLEFANNPDKDAATIMPWSLSATSEKHPYFKIAIIQQKMVSNSVHTEYTAWQKERDLPTFNIINKKTELGTIIAEGNFKYFETWSTMEIKRSDLCIIKRQLDTYIERIKEEQNKPDRIQEAITEIKERTGSTFTKNQLFRKAKEQKLFISYLKPYARYVQMDLAGHENDNIICEPLGKTIVLPKSRTDSSYHYKAFNSEDEKIFPILERRSLIELADLHHKKIKVSQLNIPAKDDAGNDLIVTSFYLYQPDRATIEYNDLITWLEQANYYNLLDTDEIDPNNERLFLLNFSHYCCIANDDNLELEESDLFIPDFELDRFIQSLTHTTEPQQAPEPVEEIKLSNKQKPKAREVIEGLKSISDTYPHIDDTKLIEGMKALILVIYGEEPEQKKIVDDLALIDVSVSRQVVGTYLKMAFNS